MSREATSTTSFKSFHYLENGDISFSIMNTIKSVSRLDSGAYNLGYDPYPRDVVTLKQLVYEPHLTTYNFPYKERIDSLVSSFFDPKVKKVILDLGFYHKMGVLLHGMEGTGKTSIIKYYCHELIKNKSAIVFNVVGSPMYMVKMWEFIQNIRSIQDNPIVVVMDEFESFCNNNQAEGATAKLKTMLDGNLSIDNSLIFAATNHLEYIPDSIKCRPSRFKYVLEIGGIETEEEVIDIMTKLISPSFSKEEIAEFSKDLVGLPLDRIKQFCLDKIMALTTETLVSPKRLTVGFKH